MIFYKVGVIGDGSEGNPFRPVVLDGVPYVWSNNICPTCNTCIVASNTIIANLDQITDLKTACEKRMLRKADVEEWFVGDGL